MQIARSGGESDPVGPDASRVARCARKSLRTRRQMGAVRNKLSPQYRARPQQLNIVLICAARYDEAIAHCAKLLPDSPFKVMCLGRARLERGKVEEAIQILSSGGRSDNYLGYAYGRAGRRDEAEKMAAGDRHSPFEQALTFAGLGDKDRTLEALDRMAAFGPVRIGRALASPEMAFLRGDPRLKALRKKVGLPQ